MNEPEEMRSLELKADKLVAEIAATMVKHPRSRRILGPLRKLIKWVARSSRKNLEEDGW